MLSAWRARRLASRSASSSSCSTDPDDPVCSSDAVTVQVANEPNESETDAGADGGSSSNTSSSVWASDDIDIAVTKVCLPRRTPSDHGNSTPVVVQYEISLRFPQVCRLWRVQRSFAEFLALHTSMQKDFATALFVRDIHFPKPVSLSWGDFRSHTSSSSTSAAPPSRGHVSTQKLQLKLNAYLRKLVEIEAVMEYAPFRAFLTPREASQCDSEMRSKTLPTLAIVPGTSFSTELHTMKMMGSPVSHTIAATCAPPVKSQCTQAIYFGSGIQLRALGGLRVGLTKRGGLSGSQKAVAVAAGVAGIALAGPFSAAIALGAVGGVGVGKYQMNKSFCLTVNKAHNASSSSKSSHFLKSSQSSKSSNGWFVVENAELVSGPRRALKFGDLLHLFCRNVRKSVRINQPADSKHGHLMVTNEESKRATLRLVSPYGYRGAVVCGSYVYIQVLNGEWAGQFISLRGDFLATGHSPTAFKICQQEHACLASEEIISIVSSPPRPFQLRVMVYNVWLLPSIVTSFNDKLCPSTMPRARAIPKCISSLDVDVVVFCEAFCATAKELLVKGMKEQGFLYETKTVGEGASVSHKKAIDGGCFAMSKYPMEYFEELTFGSNAVGDDRMADKGIIYFQMKMPQGDNVHIFGTHLQAWETKLAIAARKTQLKTLTEFVNSKKISPHDVVLIAGDLNVDRYSGQLTMEYEEMMSQLNTSDPELRPTSSKFSFDPVTNKLAVAGPSSGGRTEKLDYILTTKHHRQPSASCAEIIQLKATKQWTNPKIIAENDEELVDLSDHYPVIAEFQF